MNCVLVRPTLPGAAGVAEVDRETGRPITVLAIDELDAGALVSTGQCATGLDQEFVELLDREQ